MCVYIYAQYIVYIYIYPYISSLLALAACSQFGFRCLSLACLSTVARHEN